MEFGQGSVEEMDVTARQRSGSVVDPAFWRGKRVLVTGHTGFKGSWLSLWLTMLGAKVFGYALAPEPGPSLFRQLRMEPDIDHCIADMRDPAGVDARVIKVQPDVVFHLAAQPLVRKSYTEPVDTWHTNVLGTVHLLDALRRADRPCSAVIVTTDKVYENREWVHPYRETDRLGGHDPYSSSKAACELAIESWRRSFFGAGSPVRIASARAGNVIGGGDWSIDRIVPDLARSLSADRPVVVRNPASVRPLQHVLDPLAGYMLLAEKLTGQDDPVYQSSFNFGPDPSGCCCVRQLVEFAFKHWPGAMEAPPDSVDHHEARLLSLTISKAHAVLGWNPTWGLEEAIERTIRWYRAEAGGTDAREITIGDIAHFTAANAQAPVS